MASIFEVRLRLFCCDCSWFGLGPKGERGCSLCGGIEGRSGEIRVHPSFASVDRNPLGDTIITQDEQQQRYAKKLVMMRLDWWNRLLVFLDIAVKDTDYHIDMSILNSDYTCIFFSPREERDVSKPRKRKK